MGIEPMRLMPQISILPIKLFPQKARSGIEPLLIDLQSITLPLCYLFILRGVRLERTSHRL